MANNGKNRIFLLGLDGATFDLFRPLIDKGIMPNLDKLMKDSAHGECQSTIPCTTPVAWSTIFTGKNAGKHGIFDFWESYHLDSRRPLISLSSLRTTPFWEILNRFELNSILLNVPITYPPQPVNGAMISGMMTPSENCSFTYPPELRHEIMGEFPDYRLNIDIPKYDTSHFKDCMRFLDDIDHSFDTRCKLMFYLMENHYWDMFFAVFVLPDRIQHLFWKYIDPRYDNFRKDDEGRAIYERILELYENLDTMIGQLRESLTENDYIYVVSDHGFGSTDAYINVNYLLEQWGYLKTKSGKLFREAFFKAWVYSETSLVKKLIPEMLQRAIRNGIRKRRSSFISGLENVVDFDKSPAFFSSIPSQGIYINRELLRNSGKERDYDKIRDDLRNKLLNISVPGSDEPVVDKVYFSEEIFNGLYARYAPDLVFVARNYSYLGRQHIGPREAVTDISKEPSGFHRSNGIFICAGPHVRRDYNLMGSSLVDVAPTLLYSMGLPVFRDMDGRVLDEIFDDRLKREVTIASDDEISFAPYEQNLYTEREFEEIENRLKSLGYG
ncbi:MAG: hypothetical protein GF307_09175 [candidate division Zixibacteria bacterium]|nr:hypothetical protein [candidate division Zixibacteria bacterium]